MSKFTQMNDDQCQLGDLDSVEMFTAIADNLNHLIDTVKPGKIIMVLTGFPGVPEPDSKLWQLCTGSLITDPDSPLRGQNTPDLVSGNSGGGVYMRGYEVIGQVGTFAGSNVKSLNHAHGGFTGDMNALSQQGDTDNDFFTTNQHTHAISSSLGTINFEPRHIRVKHYIKIN